MVLFDGLAFAEVAQSIKKYDPICSRNKKGKTTFTGIWFRTAYFSTELFCVNQQTTIHFCSKRTTLSNALL